MKLKVKNIIFFVAILLVSGLMLSGCNSTNTATSPQGITTTPVPMLPENNEENYIDTENSTPEPTENSQPIENSQPLMKRDGVIGIYPGNLVNQGFVAFDGTYLFYPYTSWGDIPHTSLNRYDIEHEQVSSIGGVITNQMASILGHEEGGVINESIRSLNVYKGKLYFISQGNNNDTADAVADGYYMGEPVHGITSMDIDGMNQILITADEYESISVALDKIYGIQSDHNLVRMNLDGSEVENLVKQHCSYVYANESYVYYVMTGEEGGLFRMKPDGTMVEVLVKGVCNRPIVLDDHIFFLDENNFINHYTLNGSTNNVLTSKEVYCFNVDQESIFYSDESGLWSMNFDGGQRKLINSDYVTKVIQIVGDYLYIHDERTLIRIKKDGSDYEEYFMYY